MCITCTLVWQATDEAPLLQQQLLQQNQAAPGAGFHPWVHTLPLSISHPSFTQSASARGAPNALLPFPLPLFSLFTDLRAGHTHNTHFQLSHSFLVFVLPPPPITPVLLCNGNDFHAGLPRFDILLFRKRPCVHGSCPFQVLNRDSVLLHG